MKQNQRLRYSSRLSIAAVLLALTATGSVFADGISGLVADGKAWNVNMTDGKKMKLTLRPDGTGKMNVGFVSKSLTWNPTTDGLCLNGTPGGPKCVALSKSASGFVGTENGKRMFVLTRGGN